ncbi:hypothetical protein AVEN_210563-1 [Araneus ventricosus]|uniref:Uncharacterized protein n=1 Tax=Araneus ventricosus TaxID=182803 RepID=A0A4Y2DWX2_ARAVE|nr:hypothetical protein AVEN_67183-1 [Araneus ventricosus]GBM21360.1 hypothetical protein AVEN_210563-1 [Araneus ventricosus]
MPPLPATVNEMKVCIENASHDREVGCRGHTGNIHAVGKGVVLVTKRFYSNTFFAVRFSSQQSVPIKQFADNIVINSIPCYNPNLRINKSLSYINVSFKATRWLLWDGPYNFEPCLNDEDDTSDGVSLSKRPHSTSERTYDPRRQIQLAPGPYRQQFPSGIGFPAWKLRPY